MTDLPTSQEFQPILAYRVWGVMWDGEVPVLTSANAGHIWRADRPIKAVCLKSVICEPPDLNVHETGCGIYALRGSGPEYPTRIGKDHLWGEVYLWGKVVEHEYGYRAEYAYPAAIYDTGDSARKVAETYQVPLKELPHVSDRQPAESHTGGAVSGATTSAPVLYGTFSGGVAQYTGTATGWVTGNTYAVSSGAITGVTEKRAGKGWFWRFRHWAFCFKRACYLQPGHPGMEN